MRITAGEVGGTKTCLMPAEFSNDGKKVILEKDYTSAQYRRFVQVLEQFISLHNHILPLNRVCFAIAGPD